MYNANKVTAATLSFVRAFFKALPIRGRGRLQRFLAHRLLPKQKVCIPIKKDNKMVFDFNNKHEIAMYFDIFAEFLSKLMRKLLKQG